MMLLKGFLSLMPTTTFLPLPQAVTDALGTVGGLVMWAVNLTGDDISGAITTAFEFVLVFEVGVMTVRAALRAIAIALGARFAVAWLRPQVTGEVQNP